jgi:hypothetical protein
MRAKSGGMQAAENVVEVELQRKFLASESRASAWRARGVANFHVTCTRPMSPFADSTSRRSPHRFCLNLLLWHLHGV